MKLNKYITNKLHETWPSEGIPSEDTVEEWVFSWYKEIYDRTPPIWLAGNRWYDRRKKIEEEAKKNEA